MNKDALWDDTGSFYLVMMMCVYECVCVCVCVCVYVCVCVRGDRSGWGCFLFFSSVTMGVI